MMDHDDKGYSEEQCVRCGWVMGHRALNCQNDDTPHVFPSQLPFTMRDGLRYVRSELLRDDADSTPNDPDAVMA